MMLACFLKRTELPEREWSWFISINPLLTWSTQSLQDMEKSSIQSGHSAHSLPSTTHSSSISQAACVTRCCNETSWFVKRYSFINQVVSIPLHHWIQHQHVPSSSQPFIYHERQQLGRCILKVGTLSLFWFLYVMYWNTPLCHWLLINPSVLLISWWLWWWCSWKSTVMAGWFIFEKDPVPPACAENTRVSVHACDTVWYLNCGYEWELREQQWN